MAHTKHFIYVYPKVEQKLAPGLEVISTEFGKKPGKVTTALGCNGMGVLRLEQAFKGSGTLTMDGRVINCGIIGHQLVARRKIKSNNSVEGRKRSKVLEVYKPVNRLAKDKNKDSENSKQVLEEIRAATNCENLNSNHNSRKIKKGKSSSKEIFNGTSNDSKQHDGAGDVTGNTPNREG
ncbi:hypothetical protein LWI28_020390 [Acer negundo]|uniref:CAF17 C-terminal domain-containing protein n=1 Tax=Acer negundo TaxID=4023 RepID=A0AAD5I9U2_ACENE|nr:hypothetical protein LWI28_020390 [Acer negundo]